MKKTFLFILSLLFAFNMYADKKAIRLNISQGVIK